MKTGYLRALALLAGCALVVFVVLQAPLAGLEAAAGQLLTPWIILPPLLALGWMATGTMTVRVLIGEKVNWRALFWNRFVGDGYNALLPLGVAGEVWKAKHLGDLVGTDRAVTVLVRDRFVENVVALLYSAIAVAFGLWRYDFAPAVAGGLAVYVAAAVVLAVVEGAFALSRWPGLLGGRVARWLGQPEGLPGEPLSPRQFARAAGWALVGRALGCAEVMVLFHVLAMPAGLEAAFFAHGALAAAGFIGFFVPAAAGVSEAASLLVFEALGGPPGSAVVFALVRRARLMLIALVGVSVHLGKVAALRWLRALAVIAVIAGCVWLVRGLKPELVWAQLAGATWWPIGLAVVLNFGIIFMKSTCWWMMLLPTARVPVMRIYRYTLVSFAASAIAPARAGEVLRVWLLKRRDGVPAAAGAAVALAEKLVDGLAMLVTVAPIPWLLPGLPGWVSKSILVLFLFGVAGLIAVWIVFHRAHPERWLGKFVAGMEVLRRPRQLFLALAICVAGWALDLCGVLLILYAVGVSVPWAGGLLILLTVNMALFVPSTPAHVGAFEFGAIAATDVLGVPREAGMAFAILYHAMQIVPLMLWGLADIRLALGAAGQPDAPAEAE